MGLPWGRFLVVGAAAAAAAAAAATFLREGASSSSSSLSHSLQFFYTLLSEPSPGLPQFIAVGYVDDQLFAHYNSDTKRAQPRVAWIEEVEKDHANFWDSNTQRALNSELRFRGDLITLKKHYNQSGGLHTWQRMYGCELSNDGRKGGFMQYGYDGKDYISLDKETLTWTAAEARAWVFKRKLDSNRWYSRHLKVYLEKECIEWLQQFLDYGKESLLRIEPPAVTVARKAGYDGLETLICRTHGFYPKEIDATWQKDGKVWEQDVFRGGVVPNSDGTYHAWLSIDIHSKDRDHYWCHVEHAGLLEPLDLAWGASDSSHMWFVILGVLLGATAVFLLVAGVIFYLRQQQEAGYRATATSDQGSDSSTRGKRAGHARSEQA